MSVVSAIKNQQKKVNDLLERLFSRDHQSEQMITYQVLKEELEKEFYISLSSVKTNQKLLTHNNKLRERLFRLKDKNELLKFQLSMNKKQLKENIQHIDRLVNQHRENTITQFYEAYKKFAKQLSTRNKREISQMKRSRSSLHMDLGKDQGFSDAENEESFYRKAEEEYDVPVTPLTKVLPTPNIFGTFSTSKKSKNLSKNKFSISSENIRSLKRSSTMVGLDKMNKNRLNSGFRGNREKRDEVPAFQPSMPFPSILTSSEYSSESLSPFKITDQEGRNRRMSHKQTSRKRTFTIDGKKKKINVSGGGDGEYIPSKVAASMKSRISELEGREKRWREIVHQKMREDELVKKNEKVLDEVLQSLNIEVEWTDFLSSEPDRLFRKLTRSSSITKNRNLSFSSVSLLGVEGEEEDDLLSGINDMDWEDGYSEDFMFGQTRTADKESQTDFLSLEDQQINDFRAMTNDVILHPRRHGNLVRFFDIYFHMKKVYQFLQKVDVTDGFFGESGSSSYDVGKSTEKSLMETVKSRLQRRMKENSSEDNGDVGDERSSRIRGNGRRYRSPPKVLFIDRFTKTPKKKLKRRAGTAVPRSRNKSWTYRKPINSPPIPTRHPIPAAYYQEEMKYFENLNRSKTFFTTPTKVKKNKLLPTERNEKNVILAEMLSERNRNKKKKKKKLRYVTIRRSVI